VLRVLEPPIAPAPVVAAVVVASDSDQPVAEPVEAVEPEPAIEPEAVVLAEPAVEAVADDGDQATEAAESVEATEEALEAEMASELDAEAAPEAIEETASAGAEAAPEPAAPEAEAEPEPEPEPVDAFVVGARGGGARPRRHGRGPGRASLPRRALIARRRSFAAIDACYLALAVAPADVDLHLMLTRLYLERGWRGPAVDKLLLLGRLADLAEDADTRARLRDLASRELPDEPRLADLVA
jgi:hypothetical protein